jgi:alkanesulfonate monooxygenase SsuD/methylene tetrahydromethanopterin reductase-like flavin-dependent oxidoreductase (luciferase family)
MRAFREAVELIIRMWTEERAGFQGKVYQIDGAINEPKGAQQPHIPLWLGGGGEQVTLKLVAKWGQACNVGGGNPEVVRQKLAVLRRHCEAVGRDFNTLTRSTSMDIVLLEEGADPEETTAGARRGISYADFTRSRFVGTPDEIAAKIEPLVEAGINYIITYFPGAAYDHTMLQRFAREVMPRFQ